MVPGRLHDLAHPVGAADVAGIDAQAGRPRLGRFDGPLIVEMDVGHDRHLDGLHDGRQGRGRGLIGAGNPHDIDAGLLRPADLRDGRLGIGGQRIGHGLDRDRRIAADRHGSDHDPPRFAAHDVAIGPDTHARQCSCRTATYPVGGAGPPGYRLARVDDAISDARRHDVAFAGPDIGLGENVAIGRAQFDPAIAPYAHRRVDFHRKVCGSRIGGSAARHGFLDGSGHDSGRLLRCDARRLDRRRRLGGLRLTDGGNCRDHRRRRRRRNGNDDRRRKRRGLGLRLRRRRNAVAPRGPYFGGQAWQVRCAPPGRAAPVWRPSSSQEPSWQARQSQRRSATKAPAARPADDPAPAAPSRRRPPARAANSARRRNPRRRPAIRSAPPGRSARASRRSGSRPAG